MEDLKMKTKMKVFKRYNYKVLDLTLLTWFDKKL